MAMIVVIHSVERRIIEESRVQIVMVVVVIVLVVRH